MLDVSWGDLQDGIPPDANRSVQPRVPITLKPCVGDGDVVKTDEIRRFENHRLQKFNASSIRPLLVWLPKRILIRSIGL